jgi:hypothetical protein
LQKSFQDRWKAFCLIIGGCIVALATLLLAPIIGIGGTMSCNFTCASSIPAAAVMHSAGQNLLGWRMYESISAKLFGYGGYYGTFYYFGAFDNFISIGYGVLLYIVLPLSLAAAVAFWAGFRKKSSPGIVDKIQRTTTKETLVISPEAKQ